MGCTPFSTLICTSRPTILLLAFVFGILATPASDREGGTVAPSFAFGRVVLPALALALLGLSIRYMQSEACAERARVALRDNRYLVATRWAEKAVRLDGQNPETFFYLGESRIRRAEDLQNLAAAASFYRAAIEPFQRASALAPNDETFLIALGRVYGALGRFAEAEWMFGRALAWDPRSIVAQKSYQANLDSWKNSHSKRKNNSPSTCPIRTRQVRRLQPDPDRRLVICSKRRLVPEMCCCNSTQYIRSGANGSGKEAPIDSKVPAKRIALRPPGRGRSGVDRRDTKSSGAGRSCGQRNPDGCDRARR